jgi:hypothetical protein
LTFSARDAPNANTSEHATRSLLRRVEAVEHPPPAMCPATASVPAPMATPANIEDRLLEGPLSAAHSVS